MPVLRKFISRHSSTASQDGSLKGKRKGRELQALEITFFSIEKEKEKEREREGGGGGERGK